MTMVTAMTIGSRFLSDRRGIDAIWVPLPELRLLWSILAGRLLHMLTAGFGTPLPFDRTAEITSVAGGEGDLRRSLIQLEFSSVRDPNVWSGRALQEIS